MMERASEAMRGSPSPWKVLRRTESEAPLSMRRVRVSERERDVGELGGDEVRILQTVVRGSVVSRLWHCCQLASYDLFRRVFVAVDGRK